MILSNWVNCWKHALRQRREVARRPSPSGAWPTIAAVALVAVTSAGCGPGTGATRATAGSRKTTSTTARPTTTAHPTTTLPPVKLEPDIAAAVADINGFAARSAPFLGLKTYTPPTPDRLGPWSLIDAECDGETIRYNEIESNAVSMPCEEGPMVVWDKEFFAEMAKEYGPVVNIETIAHETGHVLLEQYDEAKNPELIPDFVNEQFADCFSGAYVNEARSRNVDAFKGEAALDSLFEFMYFAGDIAPGLPQASVQASDMSEPDQHGLGFDRLRTFDLGIRGGIIECAKYVDQQPKRVASTLVLGRDARAGREVTIEEMIDLVAPTLKAFAALHPKAVQIDRVGLNRLYASDVDNLRADYGDGVVFWALATESVADTQANAGENDLSAKNLEYQACWFGAWIAWLGQGNAETIRLSETDLDGSLYAVLAYADVDENSSIYRHLSATLAGYRDGVESCDK